jgi:quercetin dioxygenase-like cupin family protein
MPGKQLKSDDIRSAEIVLPGKQLGETLSFFTDELGFRVDSIYPADAPRVAVVSAHDIRLRLDAEFEGDPGVVRLKHRDLTRGLEKRVAPNGTLIEFVPAEEPLELPPLESSLIVRRVTEGAAWGEGRAGMQYRDLIPDRFGGRFIASHIRIPDGGPVADYVHHHHVHFQMIYCVRGWVRVAYEDQGLPMLMEAGDCFLQPPHIRHRVLESSDNMEVVEIACPAEHETCVDHELELPTNTLNGTREFSGQRFVFHKAKEAIWSPWRSAGFEQQDTGIERATGGVASAVVVRASGTIDSSSLRHDAEIGFLFVLQGTAALESEGAGRFQLEENASVAIPAGLACELSSVSADFKMLEVFVPSRQPGRSAR